MRMMKQLGLVALSALSLAVSSGVAVADKAPPPPIEARIIKIAVSGADTLVTVASGSDNGVDKNYKCAFVDAHKATVASTCAIVRVDKKMTIMKTNLDPIAIKPLTVKLGFYLRP